MWQKNLLKALSSFTGCPSQLLAIGIRFSSAIFGKNSSKCRMAKRKSSTVALNSIYDVLFISGPGNGVHTYLGLNIGTIQHTTFQRE
ncbi:hypothetical protein AAG906_016041 [Vitis piasezkii]